MSPNLTRDILLHSFEIAAIPATFKRDVVKISAAANNQLGGDGQVTIFRTTRK